MRVMFVIYVVVIVAGLVLYSQSACCTNNP
jgi:hypothetical protein